MNQPSSQPTYERPRWSTVTKIIVTIFLILGTVALFQRIQNIIPPLILALILAFILNPVVSFFNRWAHIPRSLVLILIYVVVIITLVVLIATLTPPLTRQIQNLMDQLPAILENIERWLAREIVLGPFTIDPSGLLDETEAILLDTVQSVGSESVNFLGEFVTSVAEVGVTAIFMFIVSFYLVKDSNKAIQWFYDLVPDPYQQDLRRLIHEINLIWGSFFRGQLTLSIVVGTIIGIICTIIGLPMALLMGVMAGLLEFLPSVGHGIWLSMALPLALFSGSTWDWMPLSNFWFAVLVLGIHLVFQQVDLNYIIPRIIGGKVHLHPLIVIMGILVGATVGGILGIFLAAPTISSLRVLGRYIYANLLDLDPFPNQNADEEQS